MKKIVKALAGLVSAGVLGLLSLVVYAQLSIPDHLYVAQGEEIYINDSLSLIPLGKSDLPIGQELIVNDDEGNPYKINIKLFSSVPVKQVQVQVIERNMVIPGGIPFGIKMHTDGVMVVGMSDILNENESCNPAKDAGIKAGDILLRIDGQPLSKNQDVADHVSACQGNEIKVTLLRDGVEMDLYVQPVKSEFDNDYKAGIWVRDSSAGIGTLTYYHPGSLAFAGLGHAVCDVDTGKTMPLSSGEIVEVDISGANAGLQGKPGELKGAFVNESPIGQLMLNSEQGVYGLLETELSLHAPVPIALRQEIVTGPATILATISGNRPEPFDIRIEKVNYADNGSTKNMVVRIVDETLLQQTGGIVQGMSGSPILQDGRLVGAVTHVFVNDPTQGYAIFAENMEKMLKMVEEEKKAV